MPTEGLHLKHNIFPLLAQILFVYGTSSHQYCKVISISFRRTNKILNHHYCFKLMFFKKEIIKRFEKGSCQ